MRSRSARAAPTPISMRPPAAFDPHPTPHRTPRDSAHRNAFRPLPPPPPQSQAPAQFLTESRRRPAEAALTLNACARTPRPAHTPSPRNNARINVTKHLELPRLFFASFREEPTLAHGHTLIFPTSAVMATRGSGSILIELNSLRHSLRLLRDSAVNLVENLHRDAEQSRELTRGNGNRTLPEVD